MLTFNQYVEESFATELGAIVNKAITKVKEDKAKKESLEKAKGEEQDKANADSYIDEFETLLTDGLLVRILQDDDYKINKNHFIVKDDDVTTRLLKRSQGTKYIIDLIKAIRFSLGDIRSELLNTQFIKHNQIKYKHPRVCYRIDQAKSVDDIKKNLIKSFKLAKQQINTKDGKTVIIDIIIDVAKVQNDGSLTPIPNNTKEFADIVKNFDSNLMNVNGNEYKVFYRSAVIDYERISKAYENGKKIRNDKDTLQSVDDVDKEMSAKARAAFSAMSTQQIGNTQQNIKRKQP